MKIAFLLLAVLATPAAIANSVMMHGGEGIADDVHFNGQAKRGRETGMTDLTIHIKVDCFPATKFNTKDPLAHDAEVKFAIGLGTDPTDVGVVFPAWIAAKTLDVENVQKLIVIADNPIVEEASASHNLVRIKTKEITGLVAPDGNGNYNSQAKGNSTKYLSFTQNISSTGTQITRLDRDSDFWTTVRPRHLRMITPQIFPSWFSPFGPPAYAGLTCPPDGKCPGQGGGDGGGAGDGDANWGVPIDPVLLTPPATAGQDPHIRGKDGLVTSLISSHWSSDFKNLHIKASFPGHQDFCGASHTPLMLFFDERRPQFVGHSKFKINSFGITTNWPEPDAPGYFLVLDKNKNSKVDDVDEMFGSESGHYANGFESLKIHDMNHDGAIDINDPIYHDLMLWRDRNGDGLTQSRELRTLASMDVSSISLKYNVKEIIAYGRRAQLREKSRFEFIRNSRVVKGSVIDVWLSSERG